jgi:hypothetical protein
VVTLRPEVLRDLADHGIAPGPADTPAALRERLNDAYLDGVRALRERRVRGEIQARDYARHVEDLKRSYPALALPLALWEE